MLTSGGAAVMVIGQFLVLLHLVKLWEQRANRDYAQLLILSLGRRLSQRVKESVLAVQDYVTLTARGLVAVFTPPHYHRELLTQMDSLKVSRELASRYLNDRYSGGEKKRVEILRMAMLRPRMAVLD